MSQFDDRRDAFERRYAHDEQLALKAGARRNRALGLWVAERLGRTGEAADALAREVVLADLEEAGDEDVLRKVKAELEAGGQEVSEAEIRAKMDGLMARAVADLQAGRPAG